MQDVIATAYFMPILHHTHTSLPSSLVMHLREQSEKHIPTRALLFESVPMRTSTSTRPRNIQFVHHRHLVPKLDTHLRKGFPLLRDIRPNSFGQWLYAVQLVEIARKLIRY